MVWVVNATSPPLYPRERRGTHCIVGWVGPRAGLDGCGKSRLHRDSIAGLSRRLKFLYPVSGHLTWVVMHWLYVSVPMTGKTKEFCERTVGRKPSQDSRRWTPSQNALGSTADQFTVLTTVKYHGLVFRCGGLATALRYCRIDSTFRF